jgi:hypothetical protein
MTLQNQIDLIVELEEIKEEISRLNHALSVSQSPIQVAFINEDLQYYKSELVRINEKLNQIK